MAAIDYFLKIDGIEGESADARHKGEIDVDSWSFGENRPGAPPGAGGAAGKVIFQDFHFSAKVSKASPKLFIACAAGEHLRSAVLTCRRSGQPPVEFLTITLSDVVVSAYQTGATAGGESGPVDQVALGFARIEMQYVEQKVDGTLALPLKEGWDVMKNRKI